MSGREEEREGGREGVGEREREREGRERKGKKRRKIKGAEVVIT